MYALVSRLTDCDYNKFLNGLIGVSFKYMYSPLILRIFTKKIWGLSSLL